MDFPTAPQAGIYGETTESSSPSPRFRTGLRRGKKKSEDYISTDYLDQALADFSGYIAADELYDGPFCVLSIVDNRTFRRLCYEVLDHDAKHDDILAFFRRFKAALDSRRLSVDAITTDGSPLYPGPVAEVFGDASHQVCQFHIIAEINKAILKAVAGVRRALAGKIPKLPRGRPRADASKSLARRKKRLEQEVTVLFDNRHLFVKRQLKPIEKRTLADMTRRQPQLKALREIMHEVYRLFDRRCRTETALKKLAWLRCRVRRFKTLSKTLRKLFTANIEKALTFLDDAFLPSTSNAVERGNRRHRKMQKSVYSVRSRGNVVGRIALDMQRDAQAAGRAEAIAILHCARSTSHENAL